MAQHLLELDSYALNSMTQPAGEITELLHAQQSFYFRASPLVCLADGLEVLLRYVFYLTVLHWPGKVSRHITNMRTQAPNNVPLRLRSLQDNMLFRYVVFIIGALPRAVKLFACTGFLLPKLLAGMFLGSFVILELLLVLPAATRTHEQQDIGEAELLRLQSFILIQNLIRRFSGVLAAGMNTYSLVTYIRRTAFCSLANRVTLPQKGAIFVSLSTLYIAVCVGVYHTSAVKYRVNSAAFWKSITKMPFSIPIVGFVTGFAGNCNDAVTTTEIYLLITTYLVMGLICLSNWTQMMVKEEPKRGRNGYSTLDSVFYAITNAVILLGYCLLIYDPAGTSKPSWLVYLG